ncbi:glycosyltransferase family 1 protein [Microbacterium sp. SSW1-49]|uniref:Glycosyltransferase family 1 protein n=1 Tax=Microbacterium croceum TaxID=2851645 RepID=A0ABT0FE25_9MICO|nr:glycosyltransferase [Microbacterium croceum]MCK2036311.1 glycosyltransferase family 1 protein [Microbacterium croceum]
MLILAFSELRRDPRVKRQLLTLRDSYDITVVGRGDPGIEGVRVLSLPSDDRTPVLQRRIRYAVRKAAFRVRAYELAYWRFPHIRWSWNQLSIESWDIVLANDVDTVPLANRLAPRRGVVVDLHEFAPRQYDNRPEWMKTVAPYYDWLVRRHVTMAAATMTVSEGVAAAYREYGLDPAIVRSAAMFADVSPAPVGDVIRLVHSGGAARSRLLEVMIEAAVRTTSNVTLDFYLVADHDRAYVRELEQLAKGSDRVRINDAVTFEELVPTLSRYDVGLCMIPPTTFNHMWCLPNKFFDFLQARLGIVTGPSPEMARIVEQEGLGVVTEDFSVESLTSTLDALDPAVIDGWKQASDAAAGEYSGEQELTRLVDVLDRLQPGRGAA